MILYLDRFECCDLQRNPLYRANVIFERNALQGSFQPRVCAIAKAKNFAAAVWPHGVMASWRLKRVEAAHQFCGHLLSDCVRREGCCELSLQVQIPLSGLEQIGLHAV